VNEDKGTRYHRLRRRAEVLSLAADAGVLLALILTPAAAALRDLALALAAPLAPGVDPFWGALALFVLPAAFFAELAALPLAFYRGFLLELKYGLSRDTAGGWLADHLKGAALRTALALAASFVIYGAIRRSPDWWWAIAAAVFAGAMILLTNLAPVLLLPLFYRFRPLDRETLKERLLALAARAGAPVVGVYVWYLGEKTSKANAALVGLSGTRRILVSDTLLSQYSEEEIEVVLAHELAHHVHLDIWRMIAYETVLGFAALFAADGALRALGPRLGLAGLDDIAGLPLIVLAAGAVTLATVPFANAISRGHERRADRHALETTRNPEAFVSAMKRLAAQNLAEERPSRAVELLFYTHPPIQARIDAARRWRSAAG
jgi:STE24 endopeptidase